MVDKKALVFSVVLAALLCKLRIPGMGQREPDSDGSGVGALCGPTYATLAGRRRK